MFYLATTSMQGRLITSATIFFMLQFSLNSLFIDSGFVVLHFAFLTT